MKNDKRACIFEHEGFMYVCNFELMTVWIVTEEDEANPVTTLEYKRMAPGVWSYRPEGSDGLYQVDNDQDLADKIDVHYEQYLNRIIVGKNVRQTYIPEEIKMLRVRKARIRKPSLSVHPRKARHVP